MQIELELPTYDEENYIKTAVKISRIHLLSIHLFKNNNTYLLG
jgi:hypothetical protein